MAKTTKEAHFSSEMMRCRGIEFAKLGMMVEVDGEIGTIEGMNGSANLDVRFTNQLKHGSQVARLTQDEINHAYAKEASGES